MGTGLRVDAKSNDNQMCSADRIEPTLSQKARKDGARTAWLGIDGAPGASGAVWNMLLNPKKGLNMLADVTRHEADHVQHSLRCLQAVQ
jgi:hypothetical protein